MAGPICDWPPRDGPDRGGWLPFWLSIVANHQSGERWGAARGGPSVGNGLGVNVRAGQQSKNGWEITGGHKKLSFHPDAC